jgi:ribose 5-phosphate isomerase B
MSDIVFEIKNLTRRFGAFMAMDALTLSVNAGKVFGLLGSKRIGIAADHGDYELKEYLVRRLREAGQEVIDFGDQQPSVDDDYPDFVVPLARAVAAGNVERGIAICGSGVGASVVANKVAGVCASLIHECFSAHQGIEDYNLNLICFGGFVVGQSFAWDLVQIFLTARFSGAARHCRRLAKVAELENKR